MFLKFFKFITISLYESRIVTDPTDDLFLEDDTFKKKYKDYLSLFLKI